MRIVKLWIVAIVFMTNGVVWSAETVLPKFPQEGFQKCKEHLEKIKQFLKTDTEDCDQIIQLLQEMEEIAGDSPYLAFAFLDPACLEVEYAWVSYNYPGYENCNTWGTIDPQTGKRELDPKKKELHAYLLKILRKLIHWECSDDPLWGYFYLEPTARLRFLLAEKRLCTLSTEGEKRWKKNIRKKIEILLQVIEECQEYLSPEAIQKDEAKFAEWEKEFENYDVREDYTPIAKIYSHAARPRKTDLVSVEKYEKYLRFEAVCLRIYEMKWSREDAASRFNIDTKYDGTIHTTGLIPYYIAKYYGHTPSEKAVLKKLFKKYHTNQEFQDAVWRQLEEEASQ